MQCQPVMIFITFPNVEESNKAINQMFENKLIVCAQSNQVNSQYIWNGKIENDKEIAVKITTLNNKIELIEKLLNNTHSYETFQFLVTKIEYSPQKYFKWMCENLK